jgi:hypothetical protein
MNHNFKFNFTMCVKCVELTPREFIEMMESILIKNPSIPIKIRKVSKSAEKAMDEIPQVLNPIALVAAKKGWSLEKTTGWLNSISAINNAAAFTIVLKEIAIELDKKYEDHIENSPRIFVISTLDGRIIEINKAKVKNFRNFAAFRTLEDAKLACKILRGPLKAMFSSKH